MYDLINNLSHLKLDYIPNNGLNIIPKYPQMQDKNQQRVVNSIL